MGPLGFRVHRTRRPNQFAMTPSSSGSGRSPFRRRGPTSGSAATRAAISRRPDATRKGRKQYRYQPNWRDVPRRNEVRAHDRVRPRRCRASARRIERDLARPDCRARRCWRRSCSCSRRADSRRQRGIRAAEPLVRPDDAARPARRRRAARRSVRVPRQERRQARVDVERSPARAHREAVPASCPGRSCSSTSTTTATLRCDADDVNAYLKRITGHDFTAKDFRTWAGTVLCCNRARRTRHRRFTHEGEAQRAQGDRSGRGSAGQHARGVPEAYIHPAVMDAYMDGKTLATLRHAVKARRSSTCRALRPEERPWSDCWSRAWRKIRGGRRSRKRRGYARRGYRVAT